MTLTWYPIDIDASELSVSAIALDPVFTWAHGTQRVTSYRASVTLTARTHNFTRLADLVDRAARAGATEVASRFVIEDLPALKEKVRAMAAKAARAKAGSLADALDVELGAIRSIAETPGDNWGWDGRYGGNNLYANAVRTEARPSEDHGTLQAITLSINVTYDL